MASLRPPTIWATDKNNSFAFASPPPPIPTSPTARITPALLIIIVILAVVFFLSGLLHLFVRFISRPSSSPSSSPPADSADVQIPAVDSRQLQQLFHLHDSGLDQSLIDSLPVFSFRSVSAGPRRGGEAFDCAVCLCEFGDRDRLRLLPNCGHAFHLSCIDTWLLANSTCPLCRGSMLAVDGLLGIMYDEENPDDGCPKQHGDEEEEDDDDGVSTKVFDVKLGKFANLNAEHENGDDDGHGESSGGYGGGSASVDGRRCFSMGSFQYVVGEPSLRVKLAVRVPPGRWDRPGSSSGLGGSGGAHGDGGELELEDMRLSRRSRGDSLSISKIWLWPRRSPLVAESCDGPGHGV
ncbi:RING-H2 finger protein ATL46-like [Nymphaea colorata]|uniref:RING-type E3 ubiquitin transferase n=1 Tax=Nymphaea colorata TaxID=210225 RepID=A0A5K1BKF9_9MAGN|nr:RING-H2 finger protein ATL46-like [Nymphaea colorata]